LDCGSSNFAAKSTNLYRSRSDDRQIELSHFDPATNDLDLTILNENFDIIAVSDSVDSFEIIEVDLLAGVTYTIGMTPIAVTGVVSYNLSIDMN